MTNIDDRRSSASMDGPPPARARLTRDELLVKLRAMGWSNPESPRDSEANHINADDALLDYIDDQEISEAFEDIHKWYA